MEVFKPECLRRVYLILGGSSVLLMAIGAGQILFLFPNIGAIISGCIILAMSLSLIYGLSIYHTMRYRLMEDRLVVRMGIFRDEIKYNEIKKITKRGGLGSPVMGGAIRLSGYYWGSYFFSKYKGRLTRYGTDIKEVLIVETEKKIYGIDPIEKQNFFQALEKKLEKYREVENS